MAWRSYATGAGEATTTNRIYYTRSQDNGATFGPWVLLEERTESGYSLQGQQWMAVDSWDVHLIALADGYADQDGHHGQRLQHHRSTDGGETFLPPVLLGSTAPGEYFGTPLIAASYGRVGVAVPFAREGDSPVIKFLRSSDQGANFGGTTINALNPVLSHLVQDGTQVCLMWEDAYMGGFFSDGRTHVSCSTDGGATFATTALEPIPDGSGGNHLDRPRAAISGANVYALFLFENTAATSVRTELHLCRSTDSGVTFGPALNLAPGLDPAVEVPADGAYDIAVSGANVSVVFGTTGDQLYLVRSTDGGATFQEPKLLADAPFNASREMPLIPRLAQHSHSPDGLHLLWSGAWYMHSTDGGANWTPPVNLSLQYSGWLYSPTPQVAADPMGAFHFNVSGFWNMTDYDDHDVLYRSFSHAAPPASNLHFGAHFGQDHADSSYLRYDNLQIPASPLLQFPGAFSVECWALASDNTNYSSADLVAKTIPSSLSYEGFRLHIADNGSGNRTFVATLYFDGIDEYKAQNSSFQISPNGWYHVASTYDPAVEQDNLKLYVNGELQGTATVTGALPAGPMPWGIGRFLDGAMDDLRFWDRALTTQEIRDRFSGPLVGDEAGLVAYYTFNGTWADSTGNCLPAVPMYQESFGAGADVEPLLQIELVSSDQLRLTWAAFGASYAAQQASDLGAPDWQPVSGTPALVNGRWTLATNLTDGPRFFRLQR